MTYACADGFHPALTSFQVAATFRQKSIPCDVIWMDIDYMDGFKCFTFHPVSLMAMRIMAWSLKVDFSPFSSRFIHIHPMPSGLKSELPVGDLPHPNS